MRIIWTHTAFGVCFGLTFPAASLALEALVLRTQPAPVAELMRDNPVQAVVALAPFVLGGVFHLVGRARWQLERRMEDLADAARRAESADRAKSEFLATMSHEIRTPLNGVLGMTQLLAETSLDARQRGFVDTVLASGRTLLDIIEDILDVAKIDAGAMPLAAEPFRVAALAEEPGRLLSPAAQTKGIELLLRVDPALPRSAVGDPARLRQVVTNLAGNAVKFTDAGQVVIDVALAGARGGGPAIRVEVRDTGCGIAPDRLEAVWGKFTQADGSHSRRHEGTGLGLAISRGLVELMGGEVGAASEPGRGSSFWFAVPLVAAAEAAPEAEAAPLDLAGRRVLVVDDNATSRLILAERLGAWRMAVDAASSGEEALPRLRAAARGGRPHDLVLLDQHMPGVGGADVLRELHADPLIARTVVLLLSSVDDDVLSTDGDAARPHAALVKPLGPTALLDAVADALDAERDPWPVQPELGPPDGPRSGIPAASDPERGPAGQGPPRVLVVEDNATNLRLVRAVLSGMGVEHGTASDGAEAVEAWRRDRPALVLMDVSMPVMDGHEATRAIRRLEGAEDAAPCWIVGLTAHASASDRDACLAAGMDVHLPKPIPIAALKRCVADALEDEGGPAGAEAS